MKRNRTDENEVRAFVPPAPSENTLAQFNLESDLPGLNALLVGSSVFETEQELRNRSIREVSIPLYSSKKTKPDVASISRLIHELLIFTLVEDIDVKFRSLQNKQLSFKMVRRERQVSHVCLFSGGIDSYSGLLVANQSLGEVEPVFCAHTDQSKTIHIVDQMEKRILRCKGLSVEKVHVPSIGKGGYAQLRGFLYILAATSVAQKLGSQTIIVTECGPTMYQPRFSPLDSVTMTTHPFVVRTAARIATLLLGRDLTVMTPFENLTKAEVVAISPQKDGLKYTHSCISQRFGTHDGTCYGCVIRRLATIAAGVQDVRYVKNPIADPNANAGNLYTLLTYCYELLTNYDQMDDYETGMIETYEKEDLFRRFALDNFGAIHRLISENKRVVRPIRDLYGSLIEKTGTQILEDRLKQLTLPINFPNFK